LESIREKQEFDFEPILNLIGTAKPLNGNGYFKVIPGFISFKRIPKLVLNLTS
jgi:hypothetical protein